MGENHANQSFVLCLISFDTQLSRPQCIMTNDSKTTERLSLAASVAHEDLKVGDFVAVLNEVVEFASFLWCEPLSSAVDEPVRMRFCTADKGIPLKIKSICLPFVYVILPNGSPETFDVRQVQLVRLSKHYAKTIWRDHRKQRAKKRSRK